LSGTRPRPGSGSQLRRVVLSLSAVLGGILLAAAVGEVVVRAFDLPPHRLASLNEQNFMLSDDPILKYEYRPGFNGPFDAHALTFPINADGFRDRRYSRRKSEGTLRMLLLGDSVAAGNGVRELSKIFPKELEVLLNAASPSDPVEVLNMAVGGYNTLQEAELLRVRGMAYHPDIVIVCFCINDFAWSFDGGVFERLEQQLAEQRPSRFQRIRATPDSWTSWTLGHSRFAFAMYGLSTSLREMGTHHVLVNDDEMAGADPVRLGIRLLQQVQSEAGFKSVLFILPGLNRPFSQYEHQRIHRRVKVIARDTMPSLEVIDLLDDLRAVTDDPSEMTYDGLHLTETGHRMVAEAMASHLRACLIPPLRGH
jgi:lysophospholipase L1-like esterase